MAAAPAASFKSRYRKCLGFDITAHLTISRRGTSDERSVKSGVGPTIIKLAASAVS
jgi:hypothetical protein